VSLLQLKEKNFPDFGDSEGNGCGLVSADGCSSEAAADLLRNRRSQIPIVLGQFS